MTIQYRPPTPLSRFVGRTDREYLQSRLHELRRKLRALPERTELQRERDRILEALGGEDDA
jgi:hypothetical protein